MARRYRRQDAGIGCAISLIGALLLLAAGVLIELFKLLAIVVKEIFQRSQTHPRELVLVGLCISGGLVALILIAPSSPTAEQSVSSSTSGLTIVDTSPMATSVPPYATPIAEPTTTPASIWTAKESEEYFGTPTPTAIHHHKKHH
jgi:hypothetical protein